MCIESLILCIKRLFTEAVMSIREYPAPPSILIYEPRSCCPPPADNRPADNFNSLCKHCAYFSGNGYLNCAVHPYGPQANCADYSPID